MAKVVGPLFSLSASGKIGNAMVFFGWKGLNVVRQWLKPMNPEDPEQGDYRLILGGTGQSTRCAGVTSLYRADAILSQADGQTWVSSLVSHLMQNYMKLPANLTTLHGLWDVHTATKAAWNAAAALLELADFDMPYKTVAVKFENGFQLYLLGLYGVAMRIAKEGVFNRAPYTTAIADWDSAKITLLKNDLLNV